MIKKKLVSVLLALCLMITSVFSVNVIAAESDDIQHIALSLYSNRTTDTHISGLYKDNVFYITPENIAKLSGGAVISKSKKKVELSIGRGMRRFSIDVGSGNMQEIFAIDEFTVCVPSMLYNNEVYISAIHFLQYIGATVRVSETAEYQFVVIKPYDIFEAWCDFVATSTPYFWWDQVEIGDLEYELTKAGVISLINRDSNAFRMMFKVEDIAQEMLEDTFLSVIKNEGSSYISDDVTSCDLIKTIDDMVSAESIVFDCIKTAYSNDSDLLVKKIDDIIEGVDTATGTVSNVVEAYERLKQFDNISDAQKNLLSETIIPYSDHSETINNGWDYLYDAAVNVNTKIQNEMYAQYETGADIAEATAYDCLMGAVTAADNPVAMVWEGVNSLTNLIPFTNKIIDNSDKLTHSYYCSIIQFVADDILSETACEWWYNGDMSPGAGRDLEKLETSKYSLILLLKATITSRDYLIASNYLQSERDVEKMRAANRETAILLNKVENCMITDANLCDSEYSYDISWMSKFSVNPRYIAYADKILEYEAKYGVAKNITLGNNFSFVSGLAFMDLVDFSNSGKECLMLVYNTNPESVEDTFYAEYKYEIWDFDGEKTILLETGSLFGSDGGETHIIITEYQNKRYLVTGAADAFGKYEYHSFVKDGVFDIVRSVEWNMPEAYEKNQGLINGKIQTYDKIQKEQEEWLKNQEHYSLMYDGEEIIKHNLDIKHTLLPLVYEQVEEESPTVEDVNPETIMTADEIHQKLVERYSSDAYVSTDGELYVVEGEIYENNQYCTSVRCGVPGNPNASQRLYDVVVDATTGDTIQTRVFDNQIVEFNLKEDITS